MSRVRPRRSSCVDIGLSATLWQSLKSFITVTPAVNSLSGKLPRSPVWCVNVITSAFFNLINWPFLLTRNLCSNNLLEIDAECRKWDIHQGRLCSASCTAANMKVFQAAQTLLFAQSRLYIPTIHCLPQRRSWRSMITKTMWFMACCESRTWWD